LNRYSPLFLLSFAYFQILIEHGKNPEKRFLLDVDLSCVFAEFPELLRNDWLKQLLATFTKRKEYIKQRLMPRSFLDSQISVPFEFLILRYVIVLLILTFFLFSNSRRSCGEFILCSCSHFQAAFEGTEMLCKVSESELIGANIVKIATLLKIFPSQGTFASMISSFSVAYIAAQVKKFIESGGFSINDTKIDRIEFTVRNENIICNQHGEKFIVFRVGKKKFLIVIIK
jgi:hypothetical protein